MDTEKKNQIPILEFANLKEIKDALGSRDGARVTFGIFEIPNIIRNVFLLFEDYPEKKKKFGYIRIYSNSNTCGEFLHNLTKMDSLDFCSRKMNIH